LKANRETGRREWENNGAVQVPYATVHSTMLLYSSPAVLSYAAALLVATVTGDSHAAHGPDASILDAPHIFTATDTHRASPRGTASFIPISLVYPYIASNFQDHHHGLQGRRHLHPNARQGFYF
jgi:hypothetical protein